MPSLNTKLASAPNTSSNYVLKATSSTTIGNSLIQDDGTNVAIGTTPGTYKLNVSGTGNFTGALTGTSATFSDLVTTTSVYRIVQASVARGGLYTYNQVAGSGTDYSVGIASEAEAFITTGGTATKRLIIASNGNTSIAGDLALTPNDSAITFSSGAGRFFTGGAERMRISSGGNVGIGVTPNTWNSVYKTLQIGASMSLLQDGSSVSSYWGGNLYVGADGNYKYTINGAAGLFGIEGGSLVYYGVASGTAGTNASLVERFNVSTTGPFRIYTPSGTSETLRLICADTIGDGYISYYRTSGVRKAYIGYGASNDDPFSIMQEENANIIIGTNGTERMRIGSNGNVGIGQVNASDVRLFVRSAGSGASTYNIYSRDVNAVDLFVIRDDGYGYLKANAWAYGSDRRIKENINYIETGLDKVMQLKPATFDYIDGVKNNIGWIAQDVQEVIPEAVNTLSDTNDQLTLKSDFIVPYLVAAIKEQQSIIDGLNQRLNALENK